MSTALRELYQSLVEPIKLLPVDEARREFDKLRNTSHEFIESEAKGSDIGRVVVEGLLTLGKRPEYPPIFSINEQPEKLNAFLARFGVDRIEALETSTTVLVAGCNVVLEDVIKWTHLTEREIIFSGLALPAVRIHFNPQEI